MQSISTGGENDEFPSASEIDWYLENRGSEDPAKVAECERIKAKADCELEKPMPWNICSFWTTERLTKMDSLFTETFFETASKKSSSARLIPGYATDTPSFKMKVQDYNMRVVEVLEGWVFESFATGRALSEKIVARAKYVLNRRTDGYSLPLLTLSSLDAYIRSFDEVPETIREVSFVFISRFSPLCRASATAVARH